MLETLISSRIRRTLFEYILAHANDRFYLRGVAKELGLSVSPLRRELKRLEQSGMLKAIQEGNMLFYTVNTTSPAFYQLKQASQETRAPSPTVPYPASLGAGRVGLDLQELQGLDRSSEPRPQPAPSPTPWVAGTDPALGLTRVPENLPAIPVGVISASSKPLFWRIPRPSGPVLVGAAGMGIALTLIVASLFYLSLTNQRLMSQASRELTTRQAEVAVVVPQASSSGMMRGGRWQIVPGGFGGFSSGSGERSESF